MSIHRVVHRFALVLATTGCVVSCAAVDDGQHPERSNHEGRPIVGGQPATAYEEAVLVDMSQGGQLAAACSGSLIAPRVVLTAGHCVVEFDGWEVTAPYAGGQHATSTHAAVYDYTSTSGSVDPDAHDVALVFLDSPITLNQYPTIASAGLPDGAKIVNIGRIQDGQFSDSDLFVSAPIQVSDGADLGYPLDYAAYEVIQSGDSGGPDEVPGSSPHEIVAVNSGAGSGTEVLARVDLVHDWIVQQIEANGGPGDGDPNGGAGGDPNGGAGGDPNDGSGAGGDPGDGAGGAPPASTGSCSGDCGDVTWEGQCDGDVLSYCDGGLVVVDCAQYGMTCGWCDQNQYYDCM